MKNIGPDMLANLDAQLQAGNITPAEYEARKAEVLNLIQRGEAVDYEPGEKALRAVGGIIVMLAGLLLAVLLAQGTLGPIFAAVVFVGGCFLGYRVMRPKAK